MSVALSGPKGSKLAFGWGEIIKDCQRLAAELTTAGYTDILCVARGGLIVGGIVAQYMPRQTCIHSCQAVQYTEGHVAGKINLVNMPRLYHVDFTKLCIIDDICDEAVTVNTIRQWYVGYGQLNLAVLCAKEKGEPFAQHVIHKVAQSTWVEFPWEPQKKDEVKWREKRPLHAPPKRINGEH